MYGLREHHADNLLKVELFMMYVVAVVVYALDQILKAIVRTNMHIGESFPVLSPIVVIEYIRNPGGAFSILPNSRWLFVVVAIAVTIVVIVARYRWNPSVVGRLGLGFLLAGALGNMTDRVISGTVVDYIYFKFINFPIFNLADMAVDAGIILILIETFRKDRKNKGSDKEQS